MSLTQWHSLRNILKHYFEISSTSPRKDKILWSNKRKPRRWSRRKPEALRRATDGPQSAHKYRYLLLRKLIFLGHIILELDKILVIVQLVVDHTTPPPAVGLGLGSFPLLQLANVLARQERPNVQPTLAVAFLCHKQKCVNSQPPFYLRYFDSYCVIGPQKNIGFPCAWDI